MEEAVKQLKRIHMENKDYFDNLYQIHFKLLKKNDIVLLHNTVKDVDLLFLNTL